MDPPALLDPIITTMTKFYQEPICLEPLDVDEDNKLGLSWAKLRTANEFYYWLWSVQVSNSMYRVASTK